MERGRVACVQAWSGIEQWRTSLRVDLRLVSNSWSWGRMGPGETERRMWLTLQDPRQDRRINSGPKFKAPCC